MTFQGYILDRLPDAESVRKGVLTIPGDDTPEIADDIATKVVQGFAKVYRFTFDGFACVEAVTEIYNNKFWVLATYAVTKEGKCVGFETNVYPHLETLAKTVGCEEIAFQTHRVGRIKQALKNGYTFNAVIMSKKL